MCSATARSASATRSPRTEQRILPLRTTRSLRRDASLPAANRAKQEPRRVVGCGRSSSRHRRIRLRPGFRIITPGASVSPALRDACFPRTRAPPVASPGRLWNLGPPAAGSVHCRPCRDLVAVDYGGKGNPDMTRAGTPLGRTSCEPPGAIPRARAVIAGSSRTVTGAEPSTEAGASMPVSPSGPVNSVSPSPTRSSVETRPRSVWIQRCAIRPRGRCGARRSGPGTTPFVDRALDVVGGHRTALGLIRLKQLIPGPAL